jgi:hypothetical protein
VSQRNPDSPYGFLAENPTIVDERGATMSDTVLTTKEVAKQLKISPKELRAHLRRISGKSPGVRYEFHEKDVSRLGAAIKEHESKQAKKK